MLIDADLARARMTHLRNRAEAARAAVSLCVEDTQDARAQARLLDDLEAQVIASGRSPHLRATVVEKLAEIAADRERLATHRADITRRMTAANEEYAVFRNLASRAAHVLFATGILNETEFDHAL